MKTVEDLKEAFGITGNSELAEKLGKAPSAVTYWEKNGVPKNVLNVAGKLLTTKKADHSPIVAAIIGQVESLTDAQQGEAYALLSKYFSGESKKDKP